MRGTVDRKGTPRATISWRKVPDSPVRIPPKTDSGPSATAREPHPPGASKPVPTSAVIRPPAPWIRRDPGIADTVVIPPRSCAVRIPVRSDARRRPAHSVSRNVIPGAIRVKIAPCGIVRILGARTRLSRVVAKPGERLVAIGIPLVPAIGRHTLLNLILVRILRIKDHRLIRVYVGSQIRVIGHMNAAVHNGQLRRILVEIDSKDAAGIRNRNVA